MRLRLARPAALVAALGLAACEPSAPAHLRIEGADPARGHALVRAYGCGACHTIEGVRGARGIVGPPLVGFARRAIIAGTFPNAPRYLLPWLMDPPALAPRTAMPAMGITQDEARDIAAFLYAGGATPAAVYPGDPPLPLAPRGASALPR